MVRFINIKNHQIYEYESWDEISKLGGLRNVLPSEEHGDIRNVEAIEDILKSFRLHLLIYEISEGKQVYLPEYVDIDLLMEHRDMYQKILNLVEDRI
jgi:hypothetical protein